MLSHFDPDERDELRCSLCGEDSTLRNPVQDGYPYHCQRCRTHRHVAESGPILLFAVEPEDGPFYHAIEDADEFWKGSGGTLCGEDIGVRAILLAVQQPAGIDDLCTACWAEIGKRLAARDRFRVGRRQPVPVA